MLGAGDDLKAGVWQRLVQTRGLFKGKVLILLGPQHKRWRLNRIVFTRKRGERSLVARAHPHNVIPHFLPPETLPHVRSQLAVQTLSPR